MQTPVCHTPMTRRPMRCISDSPAGTLALHCMSLRSCQTELVILFTMLFIAPLNLRFAPCAAVPHGPVQVCASCSIVKNG